MAHAEPVPFRLRMPGNDTLDWRGARSVSYRAEGLPLSLEAEDLRLAWAVERKIESLSLSGVRSETDRFDFEETLVPLAWVTEVRVLGRVRPRMVVQATRLDAFDDMPSSRPGAITLRLHRRHRGLAVTMAAAIEVAIRQGEDRTTPG